MSPPSLILLKAATGWWNVKNPGKWGDFGHVVCLVSTLAFGASASASLLMKATPTSESSKVVETMFDSVWRQDGFCVTAPDVPFWTSHDMCLYVDTAAALALTALFLWLKSTPGMTNANKMFGNNIPGIFFHGLGHGALAAQLRDQGRPDSPTTAAWEIFIAKYETTVDRVMAVLPNVLFWLFLLRAAMVGFSNRTVVVVTILAMVAQAFTPTLFGFTYVQTVLMLAFSFTQLARPMGDKDTSYAWYPWIIGFPLTLVGWMESTQCSVFVRDSLYGHLAYDAFIPTGMTIWYLLCYLHADADAATGHKVKAA